MKKFKVFETDELYDGKSITSVHHCKNIEKVSPFDYYYNFILQSQSDLFINILALTESALDNYEKLFESDKKIIVAAIEARSKIFYNNFLTSIYQTKIQEDTFKIFENNKKKYNKTILKNKIFNSDKLIQLYFEAYSRFEYLFSHYNFIKDDKTFNQSEMYFGAIIEKDGSISRFGYTNLTDKQIIHTINNRKIKRADFLEKGDKWHCFFWTDKAIMGKENSRVFDCHIHYIDYTWGLTKKYVVDQLQSDWYSLKGLHLKFNNEKTKIRNI